MEQVRCFIAIGLPDEIKDGLAQLQAQLKTGNQPGVKWVDPYGIHLTLKFLGSVAADRIDPITGAMEEAVQGVSPFRLKVEGLGVFPSLRRVQVVWVGVGGEVDKLAHLQQRLESNLAGLGFAPEKRRFTPHLTLARLRDQVSLDERQKFGQLIAGIKFEPVYSLQVEAISLMRSQLTREGAIYSRISSVELK
jgi:2'-5' RNA ligase